MSYLRALNILRENIQGLLVARKANQSDLAMWLQRDKSWINKFLNGHREIQLKDLDRIADFFGVATYQLFQPGCTQRTERRHGKERRSGKDRRVGHSHRLMAEVAAAVRPARPRHSAADKRLRTGTSES